MSEIQQTRQHDANKAASMRKRSYLFRPGNWVGVFIWGKFQPDYRDHIEIFLKGKVIMNDLGNWASPVDGAYIRRP